MVKQLSAVGALLAVSIYAQTKVDLNRQVRNTLSFASGGTNADSQIAARSNVGTPDLVATDFAGSDIGEKINAAFASFGAGSCGRVLIPSGVYTYSTTIYVQEACILQGSGRGNAIDSSATKLVYSGPPATAAIVIMKPDMSRVHRASVRDLSIFTNAGKCPNDGMLAWNPAAGGSNKWQCYDGTTYTTPIPHLAGILHGQLDPTILLDGAHITISNIDVNGSIPDATFSFAQGGFHFGIWFNGCEECTIQSTNSDGCDDGYFIGMASNGVLGLQITGRLNRRSGFHYRGSNHFQCNECLFESNQWWGHTADPTKYGAGIRASSENQGNGSSGVEFNSAYFENNTVDLFAAPDTNMEGHFDHFQSIRGKFGNAKLTLCDIPDASLVSTSANTSLVVGCQIFAGDFNKDPASRVIYTDETGSVVQKIWANTGNGGHHYYELPASVPGNLYLRVNGPFGTSGLRMENSQPATAGNHMPSAKLGFAANKWNGSTSVPSSMNLSALVNFDGTTKLQVDNGLVSLFELVDNGTLRLTHLAAKTSTPTATVQSAAGAGATCAVDTGNGVSDMSGQLVLTTGSGSWSSGAQCTVTFAASLNGWVNLTPANAAAGAAIGARQVWVDRGTNQFSLSFGVADVAPATYKFNWHAIGNY